MEENFNNTSGKKAFLVRMIIILIVATMIIGGIGIYIYNHQKTQTTQTVSKTTNPIVESYKQQLTSLAKTVEENKDDPNANKNYAVALYATGDIQKAYEQYQEAIKLNGSDPVLYNNLGNVSRDLGKFDEAISAYQKSISLNSTTINPYVNLANLYIFTLDKIDLGIAVYKDALEKNPDNVDLQIQLAIAYEQQKDNKSALAIYKTILEKQPENATAKAGVERVNSAQ